MEIIGLWTCFIWEVNNAYLNWHHMPYPGCSGILLISGCRIFFLQSQQAYVIQLHWAILVIRLSGFMTSWVTALSLKAAVLHISLQACRHSSLENADSVSKMDHWLQLIVNSNCTQTHYSLIWSCSDAICSNYLPAVVLPKAATKISRVSGWFYLVMAGLVSLCCTVQAYLRGFVAGERCKHEMCCLLKG